MGLLRRNATKAAPLDEVLKGAELPTFPVVITQALERLGDREAELREIGDILVADPGVSSQLLRIVNSASFGTRRAIESVHQATSLLGVAQLESILIAAGVRNALPQTSIAGCAPTDFWTAAARRAAVASHVAGRFIPSKRSEAFTAALLQDMAMPLLASHRSDYDPLVERWRAGDHDLVGMEFDQFGSDHATVAAQMCEHWEFPPSLRHAIASHHDEPVTGSEGAFVQIVAVLRDTPEADDHDRLVEVTRSAFDLGVDEAAELIQEAEGEAAAISSLLV